MSKKDKIPRLVQNVFFYTLTIFVHLIDRGCYEHFPFLTVLYDFVVFVCEKNRGQISPLHGKILNHGYVRTFDTLYIYIYALRFLVLAIFTYPQPKNIVMLKMQR